MKYAQHTSVSVEKSECEIKTLLIRYGASQYASGWVKDKAIVQFHASERRIRFVLPLPSPKEDRFVYVTRKGEVRKDLGERANEWAHELWEQECRQKWRALALAIKAKLESVESGIASFEEEFYAYIVMPGGKTLYDMTKGNVAIAYETGNIPPLL